jgi:hypothetical protein
VFAYVHRHSSPLFSQRRKLMSLKYSWEHWEYIIWTFQGPLKWNICAPSQRHYKNIFEALYRHCDGCFQHITGANWIIGPALERRMMASDTEIESSSKPSCTYLQRGSELLNLPDQWGCVAKACGQIMVTTYGNGPPTEIMRNSGTTISSYN